MKENKKESKKEDIKESKNSIEPTNTWINKTASEKGFIIFCKDNFKAGDALFGSTKALQEFLAGERTGINLGIMTKTGDEE